MRKILAAVALVAAFGAGAGYQAAHADENGEPFCPTEDSCQPAYEGGEWTIVEVTP